MINNTYSPAFQQFQKRYEQPKANKNNTKTKALIGATIGTLVPLALMLKAQKTKNPLKLEYGLKDMVVLSSCSIVAGTLPGMYGENQKEKINKFKEGVFQLLNSTLPTIFAAGGIKLCEKSKKFDSGIYKTAAVLGGIYAGMLAAVDIVNKIFNSKRNHSDKKISPKDCIANLDDIVGTLAFTKAPLVKNLNIDKTLPIIYTYCGYKSGR